MSYAIKKVKKKLKLLILWVNEMIHTRARARTHARKYLFCTAISLHERLKMHWNQRFCLLCFFPTKQQRYFIRNESFYLLLSHTFVITWTRGFHYKMFLRHIISAVARNEKELKRVSRVLPPTSGRPRPSSSV